MTLRQFIQLHKTMLDTFEMDFNTDELQSFYPHDIDYAEDKWLNTYLDWLKEGEINDT